MIQRIQTIYLFLAALLMSALFLPSFEFASKSPDTSDSGVDTLFEDGIFNWLDNTILFGIIAGISGIILINIFLFRNRKLQLTLSRIAIALVLGLILFAGFLFYTDMANRQAEMSNVKARMGILVPIVVIILLYLANRHISKDERIVRSMDRLR